MYKIANKIKLGKKVSHFKASTFTDNFGGKLIKNSRFLTYFLTFLGGVWLREKKGFFCCIHNKFYDDDGFWAGRDICRSH